MAASAKVDHEKLQKQMRKIIKDAKTVAMDEVKEVFAKGSEESLHALLKTAQSFPEHTHDLDRRDVEKLREKYRKLDMGLSRFGYELNNKFYGNWFLKSFSKEWSSHIRLFDNQEQATAIADPKTEQLLREMAVWIFLSREYLPLEKQTHPKGDRGKVLEQHFRAEYMKEDENVLANFLLSMTVGDWGWKTT
ncbi:MAG: hypothetical protein Q9202_006624 [Teloschistes flavicans]